MLAGLELDGAGDPNAIALAQAVLSLHAAGNLSEVSSENQTRYTKYLQQCQDPVTGLYFDQRDRDRQSDVSESADDGSRHRATYLALLALRAMKSEALFPLRFMDEWQDAALLAWLDALPSCKISHKSERVAQLLLFDLYRVEISGTQRAAASFHAILDWLTDRQDEKSGLWELDKESEPDESIVAAGALLPFFEYVKRPIPRRGKILDALFHFCTSGKIPPEARSELALVSALAAVNCQLAGRDEEIRSIFARTRDSICQAQREDGSFADSDPGDTRIEIRDMDTMSSRLAALAVIERVLRDDEADAHWQTSDWPGPRYRPSPELTEHERKILPLWLRPTACRVSATEAEVFSSQPAVSVVIPCYNLGRYLHEAVESILMQTYRNVEIIVIDDGSTDDFTAWLLQRFDRPKTTILRQRNAGLAPARNRGIARASGRYICCLDPDDRLRPEFFSEAVGVLDRDPTVGMVSGFFQMFDERDDTFRYASCEFPDLLAYNQAIEPALFRRDLWEKAGGYCEEFSSSGIEDWDLWISFIEMGYRAHVIPSIVWDYRIRIDQMSTGMYEPDRWSRLFRELVGRHRDSYHMHAPDVLIRQAFRWAELRAWANQCQRAAAWWENSSEVWQSKAEKDNRISTERQRWIDTLRADNRWLEEQRAGWQRLAEEREKLLSQQQPWIATLQEDKKWLEEQRANWQQLAEEREKLLESQRVWIGELETAKSWLESERAKWQALAEQQASAIEDGKNKRG